MVDTLTPNIKITNQTEGGNNNTWGAIADANFERIDNKFGDITEISSTGGTVVLTDTQEIVNAIVATGTLVSNLTIEFSGRGGSWVIKNATSEAYSLTVKVTGETGIEIEQDATKTVYFDGTDIALAVVDTSSSEEVTVASASTADVLGAASEFVAVSGTTTITSFGTGINRRRHVRATGAFTITHHATSLICPGGQNITTASGDTFIIISDASSNVRIVSYQRVAAPPNAVAIGSGMDYWGATAPAFWLFCFGQAVSRTTYAALYAAIGTAHGSGDGSTTFNLPDARGRVRVGKDDMGGTSANRLTNQSGGLDGDTLGATGGSETHSLSTSEMPSHTHSVTDPGHTHNYNQPAATEVQAGAGITVIGTVSSQPTSSATTGITLSSTGSSSSHNNVQPSIVANHIIFAGV